MTTLGHVYKLTLGSDKGLRCSRYTLPAVPAYEHFVVGFFFIFSGDDDDAKSQMRLVTVWRHACMDVIHTKREKKLK